MLDREQIFIFHNHTVVGQNLPSADGKYYHSGGLDFSAVSRNLKQKLQYQCLMGATLGKKELPSLSDSYFFNSTVSAILYLSAIFAMP